MIFRPAGFRRGCVVIQFARRCGAPWHDCLFFPPACRNLNYIRSLVNHMRWKTGLPDGV